MKFLVILAVPVLMAAGGYLLQDDVTDEIGIAQKAMGDVDGGVTVSFSRPVRTEGFSMLTLEATLDLDGGAARELLLTCASVRGSDITANQATKSFEIQACDAVGTPTLVCAEAVFRRAVSSDANMAFNLGTNYEYVTCDFFLDGGTEHDLLDVEGRLGVGQ